MNIFNKLLGRFFPLKERGEEYKRFVAKDLSNRIHKLEKDQRAATKWFIENGWEKFINEYEITPESKILEQELIQQDKENQAKFCNAVSVAVSSLANIYFDEVHNRFYNSLGGIYEFKTNQDGTINVGPEVDNSGRREDSDREGNKGV